MSPLSLAAALRRRLADIRGEQATCGPTLAYGFAIHRRWTDGRGTLGLLTEGGESLPLTPALLWGLRDLIVWVDGVVPCRLAVLDVPQRRDEEDLPVTSCYVDPYELADEDDYEMAGAPGVLEANRLDEPVLFLCLKRPQGWPR